MDGAVREEVGLRCLVQVQEGPQHLWFFPERVVSRYFGARLDYTRWNVRFDP